MRVLPYVAAILVGLLAATVIAAVGCEEEQGAGLAASLAGEGATGAGAGSGAATSTSGSGEGRQAGNGHGRSGGSAEPFTFFVIGDPRSNHDIFEDNVKSMYDLDPSAVLVASVGDLTLSATSSQWNAHHRALADGAPDPSVPVDSSGIPRQSHYRTDVNGFGPYTWYLGVFGNHDDGSSGWYDRWNEYLPGQRGLGVNADTGIYFSLSYDNALFIVLDSIHPSAEQTAWLEQTLQSPAALAATWKLAFFHYPVYPCNLKSPFAEGLDWVRLFERHDLDVVFVGDSHSYERTCPMVGGSCALDGVIYLNTSGGGAATRQVYDTDTGTVSHHGRSDDYDCAGILEAYKGGWHHFTHVTVEGCKLTTRTYDHDYHATQQAAFDTLELAKCEP